MFRRLKRRVSGLLAAPIAEALAAAFSDPASLEGLPSALPAGIELAEDEADWTDVWEQDETHAADPYWGEGLSVIQPAATFSDAIRLWDVKELLDAGFSLGAWSAEPGLGGDLLVPIEDEVSWEAALALLDRGVGTFWVTAAEPEAPGFFVYP